MHEQIASSRFILPLLGIISWLAAFFTVVWSSPRMRDLGLGRALWTSCLGALVIALPLTLAGMAWVFMDGGITGLSIFDSWSPDFQRKLVHIWHKMSAPSVVVILLFLLVFFRRKLAFGRAIRQSLLEALFYTFAMGVAAEFWSWKEIGNWMPYPLHPWLTGGERDVEGDPEVQLILAFMALVVAIGILLIIRRKLGSKVWLQWRSLAMVLLAGLFFYGLASKMGLATAPWSGYFVHW